MRPNDALTVSIAHHPDDISKAITRTLTEIALEDFKDRVVAIKPNDTTATHNNLAACIRSDTPYEGDVPPYGTQLLRALLRSYSRAVEPGPW